MIYDSITNASAIAAPSTKDFGKKKRTNRSAKLKQSKLGLRREQWLSQVSVVMTNKVDNRKTRSEKPDQRDQPVENLDGQRREEEEDNNGIHRHESCIELLSNSPKSILSDMNSIPSFSSSSSGSGGSCSGNITEEEDADDEDWEAIADALAADDDEHEEKSPESCQDHENIKNPKLESPRTMSRNQAWRPDDKLRPESFPATNLHFSSVTMPSSCPICYEDLDLTDTNFIPCSCGFRLCLFCHKTICDGDGRCPGCRKPYEKNTTKVEASVQDGGLTIHLTRSSTMFCRS